MGAVREGQETHAWIIEKRFAKVRPEPATFGSRLASETCADSISSQVPSISSGAKARSLVGFEAALREWGRLLVRGGHIAVTEACWMRPDPPPDGAAFWAQEYPAIRDPSVLLSVIRECGYETVGHFGLPQSSWWEDYYRPLQQNVTEFRERHRDESDAQELADQVQRVIDVWHAYSEFYSYEFFVMRVR